MTTSSPSKFYNLVTPATPTQYEFAQALAKHLGRPCIAPLPEVVVRGLFGEMGRDVLCSGTWAKPRNLEEEGFKFECGGVEDLGKVF